MTGVQTCALPISGFKYWAITEYGPNKDYYNKEKGMDKAKQHAKNFIYNIAQKSRSIRSNIGDKDPLFTLCFDAELFGHWWYEGLQWLETFIVEQNTECASLSLISPKDLIESDYRNFQVIKPCLSSWSEGGFARIWLDGSNNWVYRHTHKAIERMVELSERFPNQRSLKKRFLDQAAREVLLSMAGDWPYMMYNGTNSQFAKNKLISHLANFNVVYSNMCKNAVNTEWLVKSESRDNIFPQIDYNVFKLSNSNM